MRFIILRKADRDSEAGVVPDAELIEAMSRYNEQLARAGVMLAGEGLHPSSRGARVIFSGGNSTVMDGPFTESKELIAGFSMIDVRDKAEAIEWVRRWPTVDGHGEAEIEIREVGCAGLSGRSPAAPAADAGAKERYMILLKGNANTEADILPDASLLAAMGRRNDEAMAAGLMIAGEGLQSSAKGARIKFSKGKPTLIDGPFAEAKELVAGFWIIEVANRQEAIAWVRRYPYPRGDETYEVEIRKILQPADFGSAA